jgi:hypothetical protein
MVTATPLLARNISLRGICARPTPMKSPARGTAPEPPAWPEASTVPRVMPQLLLRIGGVGRGGVLAGAGGGGGPSLAAVRQATGPCRRLLVACC